MLWAKTNYKNHAQLCKSELKPPSHLTNVWDNLYEIWEKTNYLSINLCSAIGQKIPAMVIHSETKYISLNGAVLYRRKALALYQTITMVENIDFVVAI